MNEVEDSHSAIGGKGDDGKEDKAEPSAERDHAELADSRYMDRPLTRTLLVYRSPFSQNRYSQRTSERFESDAEIDFTGI